MSRSIASVVKAINRLAGILPAVCAGENRHDFAKNSIPDEIRESLNSRSANISIDNLVNQWSFGKTVNYLRNFGMEFSAESTLLCLVPKLCCSNVKFGSATDLDDEVQRISWLRRALTSGQGL